MNKNTSKNPLFLVLAAFAMIAGIWLGSSSDNQTSTKLVPDPIQGVILPTAKTIHPFELFDHNQHSFTVNELKGRWSVLFIGYTQCPDVCPAALSVLKQVHLMMSEQKLISPEIIFISVDPERDTYPLLAKYVRYFNKDFIGVTGDMKQLKNITQQLSVIFVKAPGSSGDLNNSDYLMDHSSSFLLINPDAKLQSFLSAPHDAVKIMESIKRSQDFYAKTKSLE